MLATTAIRRDPTRRRYVPWGMLAAIDLHGCDPEALEDPDCIRTFVTTLVDAIEMRGRRRRRALRRCAHLAGAAAMTGLAPVLGVLAGVVGVADTIPYVRDTLRGATRPHRGTWLIWGVLAVVVCLSQRADGASWSLVMAGAQAVLTGLIFALAIRMGEGGLSAADGLLIAIAGAGVAGWIVADEPIVATACIIAADLVAAAMMVPKAYRDPGSETLVTFALASVGGALAAGAVGVVDASLLCYPVYYCLVNGAIALLIHHRRAVLGAAPALASVRA